jgi:hypothetical protein
MTIAWVALIAVLGIGCARLASGLKTRDEAMAAAGSGSLGDLTGALDLSTR